MGERVRTFTMTDVKRMPKSGLVPCRSCVLDPADCGKQYQVSIPDREDTMVMCMIKGVVGEAPSLRLIRNGKLQSNTEAPQATEAVL